MLSNPLLLIMKVVGRFRYLKEARNVRTMWLAYHFLKKYLKFKDLDKYKAYGANENVKINQTIWIYWKQGFSNAPDLVKKCLTSIYKYKGNYEVIALDSENLSEYIELPDFIVEKHDKGIIGEAMFSDLLRISLIIQYGGIWCDATCFWSNAIPTVIQKASFFVFSESMMIGNITPIVGSSWFLKGKQDNLIMKKIRNCLFHYWNNNNNLPHYFIFHLLMSAIVREDEEAKKCWNNMPYICNMNPHVLQFHLPDKFNELFYEHYIRTSFIHKLTYKYDKKLLIIKPENVLQYFLKNN